MEIFFLKEKVELLFNIPKVNAFIGRKNVNAFEIFVRTFCGLWDCDACMEDVYQLSMIYSTPEAIEGWLTSLKGQKICKNPSFNLNEGEVEACVNFIQAYFPLAVKSLEATIRENNREICHSWYDGVCE